MYNRVLESKCPFWEKRLGAERKKMDHSERTDVQQLVIEKLVSGGRGLAHGEDGRPVFVEGAYPGEIVWARLEKSKKDFALAKVEEWVHRSPDRKAPVCKVFDRCGGCDWLDLDYRAQLDAKQQIVLEQLQRIGKFQDLSIVQSILPSPSLYGYRNKMSWEFDVQNQKVVLGLKARDNRQLVPTLGCKLVDPLFEKIRQAVEDHANALGLVSSVYDRKKKRGHLKHLVVRKTEKTGQWMVIFVTHSPRFDPVKKLSHALRERFPMISSIIHVKNRSDTHTLRGPYSTLSGEGVLVEKIQWFAYQIPPTAFFQVNGPFVQPLLENAKKLLDPSSSEILLDLFGGVGLFSIYLSPLYKAVDLVEINHVAVRAAWKNARINDQKNVGVFEMDVQQFFAQEKQAKYRSILVDPPRSGLEKGVLQEIDRSEARKVLYVSCDPSTLARDLHLFGQKGWQVRTVQPLDLFPHTSHVENMVLLERGKGGEV